MSSIKFIKGREILDSRGNPTVEVDVVLEDGVRGSAAVPSGASTGAYEAVELRDNDENRYLGRGVKQAVNFVNTEIRESLIGKNSLDQSDIDKRMIELDGTANKSRLGANAILGVSLAVARAAANSLSVPLWRNLDKPDANLLPMPMMNILNGGAHADNALDIQEVMVVPVGADNFSNALRMGAEVFYTLKRLLSEASLSTSVGDEGGFAPSIGSTEESLGYITKAIEIAGYSPGQDLMIAIDAAASEFCRDSSYYINGEQQILGTEDMILMWENLVSRYPIISIEDPFHEDDWQGFQSLTASIGSKIQIVGDDLFATNPQRLARGIDYAAGNAILIKVNQIGTLSETLRTIKMAKEAKFGVIISHRSGETEDSFIADLAVATNAGQIKTGSLSRSDRLAKYNQLLRIEEELDAASSFAGKAVFSN